MEPRKLLTGFMTEETITKAFEEIQSDQEFKVEGCHYIIVREDRHQDMVNFIRDHFMPDEPLVQSISLIWDQEVEGLFQDLVQKNMSIALVSDTTGEIVGIRGVHLTKKTRESEKGVHMSDGVRKIFDLFARLEDLGNPFDHYNIEEAVGFFALAVHRNYRQRGIGTKAMKAAVALVKNLGLGPVVIKGEATSNYSKQIYEKLGFDIVAEVIYEDYKENGEVIFKNMGNHKSARLYGKVV